MANTECDLDVYKHGVSMGLYDVPKEEAEATCKRMTEETGRLHDWHYVGGRVHIKALPIGFKSERNLPQSDWA